MLSVALKFLNDGFAKSVYNAVAETTTWAKINLRLLRLMQTQLLPNKRTRLGAQILLVFSLSSDVLANEPFILFSCFRFFDLYINWLDWRQFISPCVSFRYIVSKTMNRSFAKSLTRGNLAVTTWIIMAIGFIYSFDIWLKYLVSVFNSQTWSTYYLAF